MGRRRAGGWVGGVRWWVGKDQVVGRKRPGIEYEEAIQWVG